jgi:hypothetical protein
MLKLCKLVRIIDTFVIRFNPHPEALILLYILKVLYHNILTVSKKYILFFKNAKIV